MNIARGFRIYPWLVGSTLITIDTLLKDKETLTVSVSSVEDGVFFPAMVNQSH